jgi:hypothetical protein
MTKRDKMGLGILASLLLLLAILVFILISPSFDKRAPAKESYFVQQRLRNLQK